jgi:hypothetical protein
MVINLEKATPTITHWPTASSIVQGQTLASSVLTGGSADISGTFAFASPTTAPAAGTSGQDVVFAPSATANYNSVTIKMDVTVMADIVAPTITLVGENPIYLNVGGNFNDPGALVTDNVDATRTITGSGTVDTSVAGGYTLTYQAVDYAGNSATQVTRSVVVSSSGTGGGAAPAVPTQLTETGLTTIGFTASWTPVATAGSYELEVADNSAFSGSTTKTNTTTPNVTVTGLNPSITSWWYRVKVSGSGDSSTNKAVSTAGIFGNAVTLDGATQNFQVAVANSPQSGSYTVAFWMKATDLSANYQVVRQGLNSIPGTANVDVDLLTNGSITFGQKSGTSVWQATTANGLIRANTWYHIAVVRDSTATAPALKIFVNGVNCTAATSGSYVDLGITSNSMGFGASPDALNGATGQRFKGQIDDVRVYNKIKHAGAILGDLALPLTDAQANSDSNLLFYSRLDGSSFLAVKGAFNSSPTPPTGSFSPGRSPGAWDLATGDYTLESDGTSLLLELGGLEGTTLYDQIFVRNGAATLDGIVNLMFYGTYTGPISGSWQTFDLIWAQNGIVFGDNYQLIFNQAGYTVDIAVVEKDGGQLWQATVREVVTQEDLEQAAALAQPALGVAKSPSGNGSVEMMYTYTRPKGGSYANGRYVVGGVSYEVQLSTDLRTWASASIEEMSAAPSGDGMEDITVRVISPSSRGFLRLKVSE